MNTRHTLSFLAAAALLAATGTAVAGDSAQRYGRDGGAVWTQGTRVTTRDTQTAADAAIAAPYGRAGRVSDAQARTSAIANETMLGAPGRQGRVMSIDARS